MRQRPTITLLICVASLAAGAASAQGHGPDSQQLRTEAQAKAAVEAEKAADPAARAARLAELEAFLRQLVGRFRHEGSIKLIWAVTSTVNPEQGCDGAGCYVVKAAEGVSDCVGFGNGAGMQCMTHIPWPRFFRPAMGAGEIRWKGPYLDGAVSLYGIDPDQLGIRFLLVDSQSIAFTELGELDGDTLTFESECPIPPGPRSVLLGACLRTFRIRALAAGRVEMQYELKYGPEHQAEYQFWLQREPEPSSEDD
jgi:hypothetical protein